jgi:nitroreductase
MSEEFEALLGSESKGLAVKWIYGEYTREDLVGMDPVYLRALFRERIHHTIEVEIYPILLGRKELPPRFGLQPQLILDVWKERGLDDTDPDFLWGKKYLDLAARMRAGERPQMEEVLPEPFTDAEMAVVKKLIWGRRSVRDWVPGKTVSDDLIEQILEAGRAAPTGCNLDIVRFIVVRDRETAKMVWSDIPTPMDSCVLIVICYDRKVYETVGHDRLVPHNMLYDCAAAGDHMCLMAHALGLGAVWLSCTAKTAKTFKKHFGLPDHIEQALHIAVGYTAIGSIKSERMPVREMMLSKPTPAKV